MNFLNFQVHKNDQKHLYLHVHVCENKKKLKYVYAACLLLANFYHCVCNRVIHV